jgi:hypothetical protein
MLGVHVGVRPVVTDCVAESDWEGLSVIICDRVTVGDGVTEGA